MSRYPIYNNNNCFNYTNFNNYTVADDRSALLGWLSPLEPKLRYRDIQERRADNVGEWLLQTEEFRAWQNWSEDGSDKAVLFCYGRPGVGKTFMSSLVVDRLCDQSTEQNTAVTCFYLDFAARKEQSVASVLGSLMRQIVSGMEKVPEDITGAFQKQKMAIGGRGPRLPDIVKMLQTITSSLRIFVCIDALDECSVANRVKLLNSLQQILETSPRTRIFIIARPHVRGEVEERLSGRVISISVGPSKDDIVEYLRLRLDEDETPDAMDETLEAEILEKIPENMSEMLLLVSLNIDAILHESTISRRREKLNKMTIGLELGNVYDATIERIKGQDGDKSRLGMTVLMWISHAERPLRADELCYALAVQLGSRDFDAGNIPSMSTLVGCCQGLITVDKEGSTVRLIHFTLQEYLSSRPDVFSKPHSAMAEICLTYLNSQQVKASSIALYSDTRNAPFLKYCSVYWGVHAKRESSDSGISLALELLKDNYGLISTKLLLAQISNFPLWRLDSRSEFSGLHCASFLGIVEAVAGLIQMECYDINEEDFSGCTPLAWAARNGHEEVVKVLLERKEINPDEADKDIQTPLSWAARDGHEGVVKILLEREDVNPDMPDNSGRTPLSFAALEGREGVVKLLLRQQVVGPDKPNVDGRTPLSYAAWTGHEEVVKILLRQEEVNPDKPDNKGRTPLTFAAWNGHEGAVRVLLGPREVHPDEPDNDGRTPLLFAAWHGREGPVNVLLGCEGVNPDKPDAKGQTPLSYAAWDGHEGVVKILLGREDVNPNKLDTKGQTPLSYAAWRGHEGVVKVLLGRAEVSPDKQNNRGKTAVFFAAGHGHEGVVRILLGREDVNPDRPDNSGQTALSLAAGDGHEGVVKILLGREEVNPERPDNSGRTPLSHAASGGYERVVKILLGLEAVSPERPDNSGRTPLSFAASGGCEGVVKILLGLEGVNPDRPDNYGETPLSLATWYGREGVAKILLRREEVNPDRTDYWDQTPLWYARVTRSTRVAALQDSGTAVTLIPPSTLGDTTSWI